MSYITCKVPLDFLKREFLREIGIDKSNGKYSLKGGYDRDLIEPLKTLLREARYMCQQEVDDCRTEEELDKAFIKWRCITLKEWLDSL